VFSAARSAAGDVFRLFAQPFFTAATAATKFLFTPQAMLIIQLHASDIKPYIMS